MLTSRSSTIAVLRTLTTAEIAPSSAPVTSGREGDPGRQARGFLGRWLSRSVRRFAASFCVLWAVALGREAFASQIVPSALGTPAQTVPCMVEEPPPGDARHRGGPRGTNPATFVYLVEVVRGTVGKPILDRTWEVDSRSVLHLALIKGAMLPEPTNPPATNEIKVNVTLLKGDASTDLELPGWSWADCGALFVGPSIDMSDAKLQDKDGVQLTITNSGTGSATTFVIARKDLGWHRAVSDTVAFIQRLGVSKENAAQGVSKVNFAAAPGVTLATTYSPRRDERLSVLRFLSPGIGITASFLDWKDQAPLLNTSVPGQPTFGTGGNSADISLGLGAQLSLLDGSLSVLYGWNLQGSGPRRYWGIGVSFVNVYQKIQSYTTATATKPSTPSPPANAGQ